MKYLAIVTGFLAVTAVASEAEQFARAWQQWERDPSAGSLFHVITSGFFLAKGIEGLA